MADLCPKCGTAFTDGDEYCTTCGYKRKAMSPPTRSDPRPLTIVLIVLLAAACIVIGILAGTLIAAPQGGDADLDAGQTVITTPTPTVDPTDVPTPTPVDPNAFAPTSKDQQLTPSVSTPVETPVEPSTPVVTPTVSEVVFYFCNS